MYLFISSFDCRLTGSRALIKLFLGLSEVADGCDCAFVIGFVLAEEGGPNSCFCITQSIL